MEICSCSSSGVYGERIGHDWRWFKLAIPPILCSGNPLEFT